ncbi:5-deoxy-glucuronate isomerase [Ruania suaedae]|uniref:5-deoxy-glucuronate isomerase n=1 Tax=Ruania suaedae TaxID=2897774 RepID=UPI001E5F9D7B|nr:5-deoxy-glucuronate isomerase [Ruania suaedae]UFU03057.1 5-deoxy-glucuronate isomerase [Ruania suaedae]
MTDTDLLVPAGSAPNGPFGLDITPERAGWGYSGLKTLELSAGASAPVALGKDEAIALPMAGGFEIAVEGQTFHLQGRPDEFSAVTDYAYLGRGTTAQITATGDGGRLALATARAEETLASSYRPAEEVRLELRGSGSASREVRNYALGNAVSTDRLLVVEVITPGGNWSSYPPHKHDVHSEDERVLEEIYHFRFRSHALGAQTGEGVGYHRQHGTPERPMDLLAEVRSGDTVLVPHGYHGPCMVPPGYDMYYLNVMAGPERDGTWKMTDDPHYTWVRETWDGQAFDSRLPLAKEQS